MHILQKNCLLNLDAGYGVNLSILLDEEMAVLNELHRLLTNGIFKQIVVSLDAANE